MADLVTDSLVTASSNGALRLKVETPLVDLPLDSVLKIPDTTISKKFEAIGNFNDLPPGFILPSVTEETQYDLDGLALRNIKVRQGTLVLKVKSVVETAVEFEYFIPLATKFGNSFYSSGRVEAGSSSDTAVAEYRFDLKDYSLNLRGISGNGFNTLATSFVIKTAEDGDTVSIPGGSTFLILEYGFESLIPDYGSGFFGQQTSITENETSELDVLNRITSGQMFLDSVTIGLNITNPVGADAKFRLGSLSSINTRTTTTINLNHEIVESDVLLTRAQDLTGNAADVLPSMVNFEINNGNSNIIDFIQNLPNQLGFSFGFELNPLGNVSGGNDFFYYDRPFEALLNIDIPLRATIDELTLVDTIEWSLSESQIVESVNSGTFTIIAINGLPLSAEIGLTMLDESMSEIGTLIMPSTVSAPALDADRKVQNPLETRISIPVSEELADVLPETKMIRIMARFNTSDKPGMVEFFDSYFIDLKVIGNFNINFAPSPR